MNALQAFYLSALGVLATHACAQPFRINSFNPAAPIVVSSSNKLYLSLLSPHTCFDRFKANPYTVTMTQNNIVVEFTELESAGDAFGVCPPEPPLQVDIGQLPAGSYTYTVLYRPRGAATATGDPPRPFTVVEARNSKVAPYVARDFSGTWWDATDPGWGLFVWQNVGSAKDELLIAWYAFDASGKPMWLTTQPEWLTSNETKEGALFESSRPPGTAPLPAGRNVLNRVGTAKVSFVGEEGELTYTLGNGAAVKRKIQRFKP
jgi:hypothetical protein